TPAPRNTPLAAAPSSAPRREKDESLISFMINPSVVPLSSVYNLHPLELQAINCHKNVRRTANERFGLEKPCSIRTESGLNDHLGRR
ncbi:hypothetical protein, partial [Nisaea sp.]|uniref:hypothetical protein n=1 Tax=Nisaea sp. TaxID=2024842 RepID=UPI003297C1F4